ncbi:hypothetical protein [Rhodanobacter sp. L36]|uniref:hypothetical protein n=1 Tax=Rhodanobacter sp. L36 TaxID=1747221 RepID=UPI00131D2856|nr:hypothetical protein [Rhodanobacter sp. L36]
MKKVRVALLAIINVMGVGIVAAWCYLLSTLCYSPRTINEATKNTVDYNCHGTVVFITPFQNLQLHWLMLPLLIVTLAGFVVRMWQPPN